MEYPLKIEYSNQNKVWLYSNIYKLYNVMHDKQMLNILAIFEMFCKFVSKVIASTRLRNSWRLLFYVTIGILLLWFLDVCITFSRCIFFAWLWLFVSCCVHLCVKPILWPLDVKWCLAFYHINKSKTEGRSE